jgi:ribosomal protein L1
MYSLKDAALIKVVASANLMSRLISVRLGVDPRKANQMVEVLTLPHGTGKDKVLALVTPDKKRKL